ncbi:glutathione S-transferase [Aliikangiella coralliicola]|uniref:Glutathione S-transferase n=1 Tax=Aliikangiella coralliicola TaxID=2592383 RepID=A0A545UC33_9GAMM|nr:glutathione S-transferase [Aliikangiella coralliicola]TQV87025.1 glutathione S-transferase [Aliikangiella coralliicola]
MSTFKLTYFDIDGGRAEPARLAMHIGGIDFEDYRFTFDRFNEVVSTTPLKQVPTFAIDGKQITQCNAILRYLGKKADLYPADDMQALLCDEVLEAMEDMTHKLVATFGLEEDALKNAREALVEGAISHYLKWAQSKLEEQGGEYFIENKLTVADLKVFVWIRGLNSGHLDHIPTTLVEEVAPLLNAHCERVAATPKIADYYSSRGL